MSYGNPNSAPPKQPFGIQDQQTADNLQAEPVPYFAGTRKLAIKWISPAYNLRAVEAPSGYKKGGKKGGGGGANSPYNYNYYGTAAGLLAAGPVDAILSVLLNGQEVWPGGTAWYLGATIAPGGWYVYDGQTWVANPDLEAYTATAENAPGNSAYWTEYAYARGSSPYDDITVTVEGTNCTMRLYWGTDDQTVDPSLQSAGNSNGHQHPNYKGICYVVLRDFLFGQGTTTPPNLEITLRRAPAQSAITGDPASLTDGQANLLAVTCEVLTDQNLLGQPVSLIDSATFQTAAGLLHQQSGLTAGSVLLDSQDTLRSFLSRVQEMTDNWIRFNAANQLIETGIYQHGVTPTAGTYATLTSVDLTERPKFKMEGWAAVKSRAVVRYTDRAISYQQNSVRVDDPRSFLVLGEHRSNEIDRPYICRAAQALTHGLETLRATGRPQMTADIVVRREIGRNLRAGDYVLLDVDLEPDVSGVYQFFRVTRRNIPQAGPIQLSLLADNTLAPVVWTGPTPPVIKNQTLVEPLTHVRILEGTYGLTGQSGAVVALAQRPDDLITGFHLHFDLATDGEFSAVLGTQTQFAGRATLHDDIAAADTDIAIDAANQVDMQRFSAQPGSLAAANDNLLCFLVPVAGDGQVLEDADGYAKVEICSISASTLTSAGHYTLTVLRGRLNTTARDFTADSTEVWIIPRSAVVAFEHAEFATLKSNRQAGSTPDYGYFKLTPFTYFVEKLPADADVTSVPFHFPSKSPSAPNLLLTSPSAPGNELTVASPAAITVAGAWSDPDNNLIDWQIRLRKSTEAAARLIAEAVFTSAASRTFNQSVWIETGGTYFLTLRAHDSTGLATSRTITIAATGTAKVMSPVWSCQGKTLGASEMGIIGILSLSCQTPGAAIYWSSRYLKSGELSWSNWTAWQNKAVTPPVHNLLYFMAEVFHGVYTITVPSPVASQEFKAYARVGGMTDSDTVTVQFVDFTYVP